MTCPFSNEHHAFALMEDGQNGQNPTDPRHARSLDQDFTVHALPSGAVVYSHSMVPGGLLVTSRVTRLTSATSLVMRVEMRAMRS